MEPAQGGPFGGGGGGGAGAGGGGAANASGAAGGGSGGAAEAGGGGHQQDPNDTMATLHAVEKEVVAGKELKVELDALQQEPGNSNMRRKK